MSFDVRLGPLSFVSPVDAVGESVGDGLDVVGAALTAGERRPRPFKLKLPIRGDDGEAEPREAGLRLRRQVRQLIDNPLFRLQGFYFTWSVDPDLDCWLLIGGAEIIETDPGITFGEWALELSDVYLRGRPGTHRPARRCAISDLRTGLVPRDTRRLLYSTDFASQALPTKPLFLPGDVADLVSTGNRPVTSAAGLARGSRHLWRTAAALDGEVLSYRPDDSVLPERTKYLDLDDLGSVRVWDLSAATTYPPATSEYTTENDSDPTKYGWERVLGDVLRPTIPLAVDNGVCRLIWLGPANTQGLAIETWDTSAKKFVRQGRIMHALNVAEQRVVEYTPERAVIEWRAGRYGMRAILQRGWWGPRLESYDDGGGPATLEFAPGTAAEVGASFPSWVKTVGAAAKNLVLNPSFEYGTTAWTTGDGSFFQTGATMARVGTQHFSGSKSLEVKCTGVHGEEGAFGLVGGLLAGQKYAISVYLKGAVGGEEVELKVGHASGGEGEDLEGITLTTGWVRYSFIYEPPEDIASAAFGVRKGSAKATTPTFFIDAAQITVAPLIAYADGDSAGVLWEGTPGDSLSIVSAPLLWAQGSADETFSTTPTIISGGAISFERTRVLIAQMAAAGGPSGSDLASLSLVDARPVPVLIGRE
jgi:hypothetical protein